MIAEYLTRRDAEIYASELTQLYGPDVHFEVKLRRSGLQQPVPVRIDGWARAAPAVL
jgi:hypothetical protein